jgi:hypothetical protein
MQEQRRKKVVRGRRKRVKFTFFFIKGRVTKDFVWRICAVNIGRGSRSPRVTTTITPKDNYLHYARKSWRHLGQHARISHFLTNRADIGWAR